MSNGLEVLDQNRDALLLAEVAAWLHDMGKCDETFLAKKARDYTGPKDPDKYAYKKTHSSLVGTSSLTFLKESVPLKVLIEEGIPFNVDDANKPWLVRALGFCHGAAHSEKEEVFHLFQQTVQDTRLSNSFGYESGHLTDLERRLKALPFRQLFDSSLSFEERLKNKGKVEELFDIACADSRRPINDVTLWDWSSIVAAMYKAALAAALLGKQEQPPDMYWRLLSVRLNGAAFSERAIRIPDLMVRQKLITGGLDRVRILLEQKYPLGTEVYRDENGSAFIVPNIDSLLDLEDGQQRKLRSLIVDRFSAGTVSTRIVKDDPALALSGEVIPLLKCDKIPWTRKMLDQVPQYEHQEPLPIDEHVDVEKNPLSLPVNIHSVRTWWESEKEPTCSVCQLRPQGWGAGDAEDHYKRKSKGEKCLEEISCQTCKAIERKVCSICERRREDRSQDWIDGKRDTTIWIDEIANASGDLALVMGRFHLECWLEGTMMFYPGGERRTRIALRVRCLNDTSMVREQAVKIRNDRYIWDHFLESLKSIKIVEENQYPRPFKDTQLQIDYPQQGDVQVTDVQRLPDGGYSLELDRLPSELVVGSSLHIHGQNFRVAEDSRRIETDGEGAVRLVESKTLHAKGLVVEGFFNLWKMEDAKTPARLQRVWETTRKFWKDVEAQFGEEKIFGKVPVRLKIKAAIRPAEGKQKTLGVTHTYEIRLGNVRTSVVYIGGGEFISVDNLQRIAVLLNAPESVQKDYRSAADFVKDRFNELLSLEVELPAGYGSNSNELVARLQNVTVTSEEMPYSTALTILSEPGTFMALVPADKALKVANAIKQRYEEEMGKVRNRLPITVGVVFASSRTPLPAILDSGRRILRQQVEDEGWKITGVENIMEAPNLSSWPSKVKLTLEREQRSISMTVPTVMGDGTTRDEWYPYWRMASPVADAWVHVCDLREGDEVYLMPSRFDFEWLDAAARRFEVSYEEGKRRGNVHPSRPYYLEQLESFKELWGILRGGLATSQIHNLVGLIEQKRLEWRPDEDSLANAAFEHIVCDILSNAEWEKPRPEKAQFEKLVQAGVSGQLADVVEFYSFLDEELRKAVIDQRGGNL